MSLSYNRVNWQNNKAPAVNAANLNQMDRGIENAHDRLDEASLGESPQGVFTPTGGAEYPTTPSIGQSWYITGVDSNGYTYTAGDLATKTAHNMDKIIYSANGWALAENNANAVVTNKAVGNIDSPILHLPLKNSLDYEIGNGEITFTRSTTATYVDRYGVLQYADINEPRFEKEGFLVEGGSTNVCLYSNDIIYWNNALGGTGSITKTSNFGIAPDGTQTADRLQVSLNGGTTTSDQAGVIMSGTDTTIGVNRTCSVWLKSNDGTPYTLRFDFNGLTPDSGDTLCNITSEWQRFIITVDSPSDTTRYGVIRTRGSYGTSDTADVLIAFSQAEDLPFATSYIPTTSATVTRGADIPRVKGNNNVLSMLGDSKQSFVIDVSLLGGFNDLYYTVFSIHNGNDDFRLIHWANTGMRVASDNASLSGDLVLSSTYTMSEKNRFILTHDLQNCIGYHDGVQTNTYATSAGFINSSTAEILLGNTENSGGIAFPMYGHITDFKIYDRVLTSQEARLA